MMDAIQHINGIKNSNPSAKAGAIPGQHNLLPTTATAVCGVQFLPVNDQRSKIVVFVVIVVVNLINATLHEEG